MENVLFLEIQGDHKNQFVTEKLNHSWEKSFFNYFYLLR